MKTPYIPSSASPFIKHWLIVIGRWEWRNRPQLSPYEGDQAGFDACAKAAQEDEPIACALITELGKQRMKR